MYILSSHVFWEFLTYSTSDIQGWEQLNKISFSLPLSYKEQKSVFAGEDSGGKWESTNFGEGRGI